MSNNNKLKGKGLAKLKELVENPRNSLTPKPYWNPDPRAMIEPPEPEQPKLFNNYDNDDLFGQYDEFDLLPDE